MEAPLSLPIDARNFHLAFDVALGPLVVRGSFREVHGMLQLPNGDVERARLTIDVAAASISTGLPMRDRHLRGRSFLDAARYPLISFRSERVLLRDGELEVGGLLSLRGIERPVVSHCPLRHLEETPPSDPVVLCGRVSVMRLSHGVGVPEGIDLLNPIFLVVGREVRLRADLHVPARSFLPALLPALGH